MPTGYTCDVQSGKITEFKDFTLQCARAFGALIAVRDDPMDASLPEKFEPDPYYAECLASNQAELAELEAMSADEIRARAAQHNEDALKGYQATLRRHSLERSRYETMLESAVAWAPPTGDHIELRKFMIEQLQTSIRCDCFYMPDAPKQITATEWLNERREDLKAAIERYTAEHVKEVDRAENRTAWLQALRASLK